MHLVFCASDEFSSQPQSCPFRPCGEPRSWLLSCHTAQVLPSFGWHPCKEFGISVWIFLSHPKVSLHQLYSPPLPFIYQYQHRPCLQHARRWNRCLRQHSPAFSYEKNQETGVKYLPQCVGNRHRSDPAQAL